MTPMSEFQRRQRQGWLVDRLNDEISDLEHLATAADDIGMGGVVVHCLAAIESTRAAAAAIEKVITDQHPRSNP